MKIDTVNYQADNETDLGDSVSILFPNKSTLFFIFYPIKSWDLRNFRFVMLKGWSYIRLPMMDIDFFLPL